MGITEEYGSYDAMGLAELVRKKEVKPIELVDASIEGIERLNPALNAVITPLFDQARKAASGDLPQGPFTGVPYLLKDIGAVLGGVRMTMGTAFLQDFIPDLFFNRIFAGAQLVPLGLDPEILFKRSFHE